MERYPEHYHLSSICCWWARWQSTIIRDWTFFPNLWLRRWLVRNNGQLINGAAAKAAYRMTTPAVRRSSRLLYHSSDALIRVTCSTFSASFGSLSSNLLLWISITGLPSFSALSLRRPWLAAFFNQRPTFETRGGFNRCRGGAQDINSLHFAGYLHSNERNEKF